MELIEIYIGFVLAKKQARFVRLEHNLIITFMYRIAFYITVNLLYCCYYCIAYLISQPVEGCALVRDIFSCYRKLLSQY